VSLGEASYTDESRSTPMDEAVRGFERLVICLGHRQGTATTVGCSGRGKFVAAKPADRRSRKTYEN
jgi:hypothetical protein